MDTDETMLEGESMAPEEDSDSNTAYLPAAVAGNSVKVGGTITLKVIAVDEEDGTVEVAAVGGATPAEGAEDPNESLDKLEG